MDCLNVSCPCCVRCKRISLLHNKIYRRDICYSHITYLHCEGYRRGWYFIKQTSTSFIRFRYRLCSYYAFQLLHINDDFILRTNPGIVQDLSCNCSLPNSGRYFGEDVAVSAISRNDCLPLYNGTLTGLY